MELQDTAQIEGGFRALRRGEVVGANMCFFPGMVAPSTVVVSPARPPAAHAAADPF